MNFAVKMTGITKRFGSVTALDGVNLDVEHGNIHALVGENGAGKTTLMRVLYGAIQADEGSIELGGKPVRFSSSEESISAGIGMVSQHYAIIPELTCLQNLILGAEGRTILRKHSDQARAEHLADQMGFSFDWQRPASALSPSGAQKLEILKLLWRQAQIMILDEPTAMLSPADGDALFASLRQLVQHGATVILVTHRLPEVLDHCHTVTVLRGGLLIAEKPVAQTTGRELAEMIVGGAMPGKEPPPSSAPGYPILEISDVSVLGDRGQLALKGISLEARSGEIVGIAGVDGGGQRELFQAIAGLMQVKAGRIAIDGRQSIGAPTSDRIREGLRIIPEDRHSEGVVESWSLIENAALGLQRLPPLARGNQIVVSERKKWADDVVAKFKTRHGGLNQPMASLSGGNQQRFVAARALGMAPKLILAFQPARGLDLGGTADVYRAIRAACDAGAAAVVVSFDLDELLEHCDRMLVMNGGEIFKPMSKDRSEIGRLMVGAK